ncbi:MAG: cytochrome D ubiquinol oxidase subunit II, partial [Leptolyngbya sp. ERB_1_2]
MTVDPSELSQPTRSMLNVESLRSTLNELLDHLPTMQHGALIAQALTL